MRALGSFIIVTTGFLSLALEIAMLSAIGGWGLVVLGIFVFPLVYAILPLYAIFAWDIWLPAIIGYGGLAIGGLLYGLGSTVGK